MAETSTHGMVSPWIAECEAFGRVRTNGSASNKGWRSTEAW
jgi:hypothetical protein